jgi:hypothetical protein
MRYEDLPSLWKKRISGSIVHMITSWPPSYPDDKLLSMWLEDRFFQEDGRLFYLTGPTQQTLEIDEELYQELQEIFRERRARHVKKALEWQAERERRQAEREKRIPATEKQKDFILALLEKNKEFRLAKPLDDLNIGEASRVIRFLTAPYQQRPEDLVIQVRPVEFGRVLPFPRRGDPAAGR